MIKIYHNPRCRKSREGLEIIENLNVDFKVIKYLETPLTTQDIHELLTKLDINPIELVRKNEQIWKEEYKGRDLTDAQIVGAMEDHPKLIERPIIVKNTKAIIGRPADRIVTFIKSY